MVARTKAAPMGSVNYHKAPPAFSKEKKYDQWKKKLEMWQLVTTIEKAKQGAALYLSLDDDTQELLAELDKSKIHCDDGVKNIVVLLDKLYLKDKAQAGTEALEQFFGYKRQEKMTINEYINEFDKRYSKIKQYGSSLSDDCLGFRLLKSAELDAADEKLVKSHGTLTYNNVKTQLKRVLTTDSGVSVADDIKVENELALYSTPGRGQYGNSHRMPRYQRGFRGISRGASSVRGRGAYQMQGTNPLDQYGNISVCACCGSRYHWISKCSEKKNNATYYEELENAQSEDTQDCFEEDREETYYQVTLYQEDYDTPGNKKSLMFESFNCAIIDCGASKTVCGQIWLDCFIESLDINSESD